MTLDRFLQLTAFGFAALFHGAALPDAFSDWTRIALAQTAVRSAAPGDRPDLLLATQLAMLEARDFASHPCATRLIAGPPLFGPMALSADAAAASAAHRVLTASFPENEADLDVALAATLQNLPSGSDVSAGIVLGRSVGDLVLAVSPAVRKISAQAASRC